MRTTVERVPLDPNRPTPADCLAPEEAPELTVDLDGGTGWVAATDREVLVYHPGSTPPLTRVPRPNVTALALHRDGGETLLAYVPRLLVFGGGSLVAGFLLRGFDLATGTTTGAEQVTSLLSLLSRTLATLASGLLLLGLVLSVAGLGAVVLAFYLRGLVLAVERGEAPPVTCPTTEREGRRVLSQLTSVVEADEPSGAVSTTRVLGAGRPNG